MGVRKTSRREFLKTSALNPWSPDSWGTPDEVRPPCMPSRITVAFGTGVILLFMAIS